MMSSRTESSGAIADKCHILVRAVLWNGIILGFLIGLLPFLLFVQLIVDPTSSWAVTVACMTIVASCAAWVWHGARQLMRAVEDRIRRRGGC